MAHLLTYAGRAARPLFLVVGLWMTSGCGILDEGDPETVRVAISGADGHPIELVTTSDFDVIAGQSGDDREVVLYSADTMAVTSPFSQRYELGPRMRFYAIVTSDQAPTEEVLVKIWVEDDLRYNRETVFGDEVLEFLYTFR